MKKLLIAFGIILSLWASPAAAQCNGKFAAGAICGSVGGGAPGPIPNSSIPGVLPLPNGDIYVGSAGGVAAAQAPSGAGDCTFTFTNLGVFTFTCLKTNGNPFGTLALLNGSYIGTTTRIATYVSATPIVAGHVATGDGNGNIQDGGAATGTVTSVACGNGLSCSPSPIINTGTITNGAAAVTGAVKSNGSGSFSQAATGDLSDVVTPTTWTPSDQSGASLTFTSVTAIYTRIGKHVVAQFRLTYPTTGNGSTAAIGGLPVASSSSGATFASGACNSNVASNFTLTATMAANATQFGVNNAAANFTNANLTGATLTCTLSYISN